MPNAPWTISPANPNIEQGGGDLAYPHKEVEDAEGPWVIFHNVDVAESGTTNVLNHAAVPKSWLTAILHEMEGVAGVKANPGGSPQEIAMRPAEANADFFALPDDQQEALRAKWPGQVVKTDYGYVQVPAEEALALVPERTAALPDPANRTRPGELPTGGVTEDPLAAFADGQQEVPGALPGVYEPADPSHDGPDNDEVPVV